MELVHVDKLLPYQADFGEELHSWLQDEELGGHKVAGTQTDQSTSPSNSLPERPPMLILLVAALQTLEAMKAAVKWRMNNLRPRRAYHVAVFARANSLTGMLQCGVSDMAVRWPLS